MAVVDAEGISHWAEVEKYLADVDIAILRLPEPLPTITKPARLTTRIEADASIWVYGYPRSYDHGLWTRGRALGAVGERVKIDVPEIGSGNSGAGVTNEADEVVGIVSEIRWMIPVSTIARHWPPLREFLASAGPATVTYPGYLPDSTEGEDLLGRTREVEAMAALLTARQTIPPLSVGLFGDWGTGKSFFMSRLRREIDHLALMSREARDAGQPTAMCAEVRQIVFNAWHYTDANLWPSLVSAIFAGLAQRKAGESPSQAEQRWRAEQQRLARALETTRSQVDDAEARLVEARSEVDRLKTDLSTLENQRRRERDSLMGLSAAAQAVRQDPLVQAQVAKVHKRFELEHGTELVEIRRLAGEGLSVTRRLTRIWQLMRDAERRRFAWLFMIGAGLGATGCLALLWFFGDRVWQIAGAIVALLAPIVAAATPIVKRLLQGLGVIETAAAAAAAAEEEQRARLDQQKEAILADLSTFDSQQAVLRQEIAAAEGRVQEAERALRDASTGRLLTDFITERSASNDYRSQLGVIATIRRDFEQLAELMELPPEGGAEGPPPIDRIVLYIDDLDRCAPDRVVEVLQAINLLLGLRLFVAVVAVDARWLQSSLELHFERVLGARPGPNGNPAHWSASPMNYLEKIIQIPYNLSPMGDDDFANLLGSLFAPRHSTTIASAPGPMGPQTTASANPTNFSAGGASTAEALQRLSPSALEVTERETEFAGRLYPFVQTPRAAKRLANLYRLIRASLPPESLKLLVDDGAHEIVLLLLAWLIGRPAQAVEIFDRVMGGGDDSFDLLGIVLSKDYKFSEVKPWVRIVARYSFHVGQADPKPQLTG